MTTGLRTRRPSWRIVRRAARREPSRRTERVAGLALLLFGLLLVLVEAGWDPLLSADARTRDDVHHWAREHDVLAESARVASAAGSTVSLVVVVTLLGSWLAVRGRRDAAVFVVVTAAVGATLNYAVKLAVGRSRPELADPIAVAPGLSFPSGHAMNATTVFALVVSAVLFTGLVEVRGRPLVVAGVVAVAALPVLIGLSRIVLGVHYLSDVLAGWMLGVGWVLAATSAARPWRRDVVPDPPDRADGAA